MRRAGAWARRGGRALRAALVTALLLGVLGVQVTLALVWLAPVPTADLATTSGALVLTDRHGEVIATVSTGAPDRDQWVALAEIPAIAVSAVITSEDHRFWEHRGVDGLGLLRAAWLDLRGGALAYGGSTLTMQLARMLRGTTTSRTLTNKAGDTLYALRLERALSKRAILEHWLNRAYFGNGAHGIDAAARLYFGKPVRALSTGEAVLLAVIPRAPGAYDPLRHLAAARARRDRVLAMLVASAARMSPHDANVAATDPAGGAPPRSAVGRAALRPPRPRSAPGGAARGWRRRAHHARSRPAAPARATPRRARRRLRGA